MKVKPYVFLSLIIGTSLWVLLASFVFPDVFSDPGLLQKFSAFFSLHWISISLIVSELAAFLPSPYNGIAISLLKFFKAIFTNNSNH